MATLGTAAQKLFFPLHTNHNTKLNTTVTSCNLSSRRAAVSPPLLIGCLLTVPVSVVQDGLDWPDGSRESQRHDGKWLYARLAAPLK